MTVLYGGGCSQVRCRSYNNAFRIGPLNFGNVRPIDVKLTNIWDKRLVLMWSINFGNVRPIDVKLTNIWDKRLVLSNCRKLWSTSDYMRKVYIAADEPVEVRRKRVLTVKAERSGKVVVEK